MPPSPSRPHHTVRGMERLRNVVASLDESCPWTRSVSASEMLTWLRGELDELGKEIKEAQELSKCGNEKEVAVLRNAIISEMGDVLFDALMAHMMVRREFDIDENEAWDAASEKVERRTPYMKEWGDGTTIAETPEEAELIWQTVKKEEKRQMREHGPVSSNVVMENIRTGGLAEEERNDRHSLLSRKCDFGRPIAALLQGMSFSGPVTTAAAAGAMGFLIGFLMCSFSQMRRS